MINKIGIGVPFFDQQFGGVYYGRQVLCVGKHGSGKSLLAYHFAKEGLDNGEKVLLLSSALAKDVLILGECYNMSFDASVKSGQLTLLEYAGLFERPQSTSADVMLPPEAFMELQDMIETQSISRLILDTVIPWVAIQPVSRLAEHAYSFIHALDRLSITTLMTLPKPVSNAAFALKKQLEDLSPITIMMDTDAPGKRGVLHVTKYLGEAHGIGQLFPFDMVQGIGLVEKTEVHPSPPAKPVAAPVATPTVRSVTSPVPSTHPVHSFSFVPPNVQRVMAPQPAIPSVIPPAPSAGTGPEKTEKKIRFSSVIHP